MSQAPEAQRHMRRGWVGQCGEPTGHASARAARKAVQWAHGTRGRTCVQQSSLHRSSEVQTDSLITVTPCLCRLSQESVTEHGTQGLAYPCSVTGSGSTLPTGLSSCALPTNALHATPYSQALPSYCHQIRKKPIHCVLSPHQHEPAAQLKTKPTAGDCQRRSLC